MVKNDFCHSGHYIPPSGKINYGAMPRASGHQKTADRNYFFNGMKRGSHEMVFWQYTISGMGMVEFNGKKIPVRPGEAFLLTIPEKHLYYLPENSSHWEFLFLSLEGCESLRMARELQKIYSPVSASFASNEAISLAWEILRRSMENDFSTPQDAAMLTYRFMLALSAGGENASDAEEKNIIQRIHHFCLKNLAGEISVEDMAQFAGFSRSHFCRIFREHTGKAPHEYLLELRVNMAMRMLQNSHDSVKEISDACGFAETGYFCKVFRRFTGTTPGAFRHHPGKNQSR